MAENEKSIPKRRFKEFQDTKGWEQRKLGELMEIASASRVHKDEWTESGVPFFRSSDVVAVFKGVDNNKAFISFELYEELSKKSGCVQMNDLLVTGGGSIGIPYLVRDSEPLYFKDADLIWLKNSNNINSSFLYTFFTTATFRGYVNSITHIGTISHYTIEQVKSTPIKVPEKEEQRKIGDYFSDLDNLINLNKCKLEKTKALKAAYLSEMFPAEGESVPKRRFAGFADVWEQCKLEGISSFITKGTTPLDKSSNGNINFIKIESINPSSGEITISTKITEQEHEGYLKRSQLQEKDILFSIAGTLGRVTVINKGNLPANTNQALAIIRLMKGNINYVTTFLKGKVVSDYIKKNPTVGAQPNLSLEQVGNLEIMLPTNEEQIKIGNFFQQLDDTIALHQCKLEKLQNIKKAYLNEMFI